jgi:phage terminase large subunit GpA-like protein
MVAVTAKNWLASAWAALRPPPKITLSEWADRNFRLSPESSANPGRWKTIAYQRGIMDAITDPKVERVSVMKGARVGYTKVVDAAIGFYIAADPCPILVVQPSIETAKIYSKEEIAPMLRDVEILAGLVSEARTRSKDNTVSHKTFPGGVLSMVGANSGKGFRMISRRVVVFDEVDAYPPSAGNEGDPIKLGEKRTEYYWNRKIVAGSTPLVAGHSRIEELFLAGDRRRYYVPCPHCGRMDFLRFNERGQGGDDEEAAIDGGHIMQWPKDRPEEAVFNCRSCGCDIEEKHKRAMIEAGEWRAAGEFKGHASFHIWAAYSLSPNATWGQIAAEFIEAKADSDKLKTFVNTVLGETWKERGDAPEWEILFKRREAYKIATVPSGVVALTAGVDVQQDRFVFEIVGWTPDKETFGVDRGLLFGDTSDEATWTKLDELLARTYHGEDGAFPIAMMAVDSGYRTQMAYNWGRRHPRSRVMVTKGVSGAKMLVGQPTKVEVSVRGRKLKRGYQVWPIGIDLAKSELYGWLRLARGDGDPPPDPPAGYCHFPADYDEEYFKQLTAEQLVTTRDRKTNRAKHAWHVLPNRENHYLDTRVLNRIAAAVLGIDRMPRREKPKPPPSSASATSSRQTPPSSSSSSPAPPKPKKKKKPKGSDFWGGDRGGGWFR